MKLKEFFSKAGTKNIVINTDIDGFLSGMILHNYYGCTVVGFTNSKDAIWLSPEITSIYEPVYIDIFVNSPEVYCIDQHIVAYNNNHLERLLAYGTKLNPNLDISKRTFCGDLGEESNYYCKYPFGTVHYLIARMKEDGYELGCNPLDQEYKVLEKYYTCPGQILLRADDALYSSLGPYKKNTDIWWSYLSQYHSNSINQIIDYINNCDVSKNCQYKNTISQMFREGLKCDGSDGSFDTITKPDGKTIQDRVLCYNQIIGEIMGLHMDLPKEVVVHRGSAKIGHFSENNLKNAFTYAFVYSPKKEENAFSFTVDIK